MSLKRVLIVYFQRPPIIEYLRRAFEKKGVEVKGFYTEENHWFDRYFIHVVNKTAHNLRILPKNEFFFKDHPLSHYQYRNRKLLETVNGFCPDLVFIVRGHRYSWEILREIKERAVLFGWWVERAEDADAALREAGFFDHCFFIHSSIVKEADRAGLRSVSLLHHSVDSEIFRPMGLKRRYDWSFVGGFSEKRLNILEVAVEVSGNGAVYGPKWRKKNLLNHNLRKAVKGDSIWGEDLVRLYNESRVVLNITNWGRGEGDKRSGMNMRVLEVPACGACLITDDSRELKTVVTPGTHVVLYEGLDDFARKLGYYITHREEREKIAEAGYRHVTTHYTYDDVARIIMDTYNGTKDREKRGRG